MDNFSDFGYDVMKIDHIEKIAIIKALEHSHGNQVASAKLLGVHRNTLRNKIKRFNIDVGRFK